MRKRILLAPLLVAIIFAVSALPVSAGNTPANSYNELYALMLADITEWKTEGTYQTTFEPKKISLEKIKEEVGEEDPILAICLYGCSWEYEKLPDKNGTYTVKIEYEYYMTAAEREKVEKTCEKIAKSLDGKTDYEKTRAVHDYIILNCEYSLFHNGPYNCLFNGQACCNGYALAFQMTMDTCGVESRYVANSNHAWNIVNLDGVWYNIDLTWDDGEGENVLYTYFLKSNADFPDHPGANATAIVSYPEDPSADNAHKLIVLNNPIVRLASQYWYIGIFAVFVMVYVFLQIRPRVRKKDAGKESSEGERPA